MVEALRNEGVADSAIKEKISSKYRDEYKDAYKMYLDARGNEERREVYRKEMRRIEKILDYSGFEFDFSSWMDQVEAKYTY